MKYEWSADDVATVRYNCAVAQGLNDRMTMVMLRSVEARRIHEVRSFAALEKLRFERMPKGISFTPPANWNWTHPIQLPEDFTLWPLPPEG